MQNAHTHTHDFGPSATVVHKVRSPRISKSTKKKYSSNFSEFLNFKFKFFSKTNNQKRKKTYQNNKKKFRKYLNEIFLFG